MRLEEKLEALRKVCDLYLDTAEKLNLSYAAMIVATAEQAAKDRGANVEVSAPVALAKQVYSDCLKGYREVRDAFTQVAEAVAVGEGLSVDLSALKLPVKPGLAS